MIAEAFLTCALAASPLVSFATTPKHPVHGPLPINGHARVMREFSRTQRMLVVDGDPRRVQELREAGVKAFGAFTQDWPYITKQHAVMNPGRLAFAYEAFQTVIWVHPNELGLPAFDWLVEAAPLIVYEGFLIFDEEQYPGWMDMLARWNWRRMKHRYDGMAVYQKPELNLYQKKLETSA